MMARVSTPLVVGYPAWLMLPRPLDQIPAAMARPLAAASTLAALVGSALMLWAVAFGSYARAGASLAVFVVAGLLWHLAEFVAEEE